MSSVNISIKKEAYTYLKSIKKEGESFSDVILKFKEEKKNGAFMVNLALALKERAKKEYGFNDADLDEKYFEEREKNIKQVRQQLEKELKRHDRT